MGQQNNKAQGSAAWLLPQHLHTAPSQFQSCNPELLPGASEARAGSGIGIEEEGVAPIFREPERKPELPAWSQGQLMPVWTCVEARSVFLDLFLLYILIESLTLKPRPFLFIWSS